MSDLRNRLFYFLMTRVYPRERWLYDHLRSYREWWGEREEQA